MAKTIPVTGTRRTREHIIASQSHNYVEKFFIDKGHTIDFITDYGTDAVINTFDEHGYAEGGDVRLQLKASDRPKYSKDGTYISFTISVKHYLYWMGQVYPVFLIVYDAKACKAFWLYIQAYFKDKKPKKNAASTTVRIPIKNKFTKWTVDYMRRKKDSILETEVEHED